LQNQSLTTGSEYLTHIQVDPEVLKELRVPLEDLESTINNIIFIYAKGGFIRRSDIVGSFVTNKIYEENALEGEETFDELSGEFKGVAVIGSKKGESLWIPDAKLHDALRENQVILVMKSPRRRGISSKEVDKIFITPKDKSNFS